MTLNAPIIITLLRIVLIPVMVLLFYLPFGWTHLAVAAVFVLAAVSDWLDGFIARRTNQLSPFGAFLDPVADKLMVATALVLLVQQNPKAPFALAAAVIAPCLGCIVGRILARPVVFATKRARAGGEGPS